MAESCQQLMLAGSLESPPEHCENDALPGLEVCKEHAEAYDPDMARDIAIDQQMEE